MDERDRREWILVGGLVVAFGLVLALLSPQGALVSFDRRLASTRASDDGALALYLTLRELGVPVGRRTTPLADAGPVDGFTALLAPTEPLTPREVGALLDRVRQGGALLYAPSGSSDALLDTLGLELGEPPIDDEEDPTLFWDVAPTDHRWVTPADTAYDVEAFVTGLDGEPLPGVSVLAWSDSLAALLELPWGDGRIVVVSDHTLLANDWIREGGLAPVLVRAVTEVAASAGPLVFDDYHHGVVPGGLTRGVAAFLVGHPAGHLALQILVVVALALLAAGWPFGAPVPLAVASRRSPLEHVRTLAATYREADARRLPRLLLLGGLARHLGRPRPRDEDAARDLVAHLDPSWSGVRHLTEALERDADLVAIAAGVDEILLERRMR